jgi:hypothetical protein
MIFRHTPPIERVRHFSPTNDVKAGEKEISKIYKEDT